MAAFETQGANRDGKHMIGPYKQPVQEIKSRAGIYRTVLM